MLCYEHLSVESFGFNELLVAILCFHSELVFIIFQQSLDVVFDDKQISFILGLLRIIHQYVIKQF